MTNPRTLAAYESGVDRYLGAVVPTAWEPFERYRQGFLESLPPAAGVLELGSGPGLDADWFERRGVQVRRSDATVAFVERLRRRGFRADVLNVISDELGGPYDGVWANAVLLHLSRNELADALGRIRRALKPGGVFAFSVKDGDGEAWVTDKLADPRYFVYWRLEPLREILDAAGWQVEDVIAAPGRSDDWLMVRCRA